MVTTTNTSVPAKNLTKKTRSSQHSSTTSVTFEHMKSNGFRVKMTMHKSSCVTVEIPTLAEKLLWASNVSSQECDIFFDWRNISRLKPACMLQHVQVCMYGAH